MKYGVTIPLAGSAYVEVEADAPDAAEKAAWEQYNEEGLDDFLVEYDLFDVIAEGNVCNAPQNRLEVEEIGD